MTLRRRPGAGVLPSEPPSPGPRPRAVADPGWIRVMVVAYLVATGLGVMMRLALAGVEVSAPFDHLLHAHSHTLYFGWAGLGVLVGAIGLVPRPSPVLRATVVGIAVTLAPLAVGFFVLGYHPLTIAVSTVMMLGWYLAVARWWWEARGLTGLGVQALRAGFAYLVASSLGVWALASLQASGRGTALTESLAVHAFLLGFGWFVVLGLVGLVVLHAPRLGLALEEGAVHRALAWWIPLAWLTFPLGVVGGPEVPVLGPLARIAGVALLLPAAWWVMTLWRAAPRGPDGRVWRVVAAWFAVTTATTAAVGLGGSAALLAGGRQGVVIHLHALFVGFVTTALIALFVPRLPRRAVAVHTLSLGGMLGALALVALGAVTVGMAAAAGAAVVLWGAGLGWAVPMARETR